MCYYDRFFAHLNPKLTAVVSGVLWLRAAHRYRWQNAAVHMNDPPFFTLSVPWPGPTYEEQKRKIQFPKHIESFKLKSMSTSMKSLEHCYLQCLVSFTNRIKHRLVRVFGFPPVVDPFPDIPNNVLHVELVLIEVIHLERQTILNSVFSNNGTLFTYRLS